MCDKTLSIFELLQLFPDADATRQYLERRRWDGEPVCPHCDECERITARGGKRTGYYRCRGCEQEFTVRTGTIFERSHVPLHKWVFTMYLVVTARKGISSLQMSSVESMWALLKRGLYGTWHKASRKHLARNVNERTFRLNEGNVEHYTRDRIDSLVNRAFAHRVTYARLTT